MKYQLLTNKYSTTVITIFFVAIRNMILIKYLINTLDFEQYGEWVLLNLLIENFPYLLTLGVPYGIIRYSKGKINSEIYWTSFIFSINTGLFLLILIYWGSKASNVFAQFNSIDPNNITIFILFGIIMFDIIILNAINFYRGALDFANFSYLTLMKRLISLVLIFMIFTLSNASIVNLLIGIFLSYGLVAIQFKSNIISKLKSFKFSLIKLKKLIIFGFPTVPNILILFLIWALDRFFLLSNFSYTEVTVYDSSSNIAYLIRLFLQPIIIFLPGIITKIFEDRGIFEFNSLLRKLIKYYTMIIFLLYILIVNNSKLLLIILTNTEIMELANQYVWRMCIAMILYGYCILFSMGYFVEKKLYLETRNWLFSLIAYLLLNYLLIPIYDITGAIIALNICFVVYICMSIQNISKYISFKYFCKILISMTIGISLHGMTMFFDFSIFGSIIFTIIEFLIIIIIFKKFVNYDELKSDLKIIFIK